MTANNSINIKIIPDDSSDTDYETDVGWQLQCRDIFLSLRDAIGQNEMIVQPERVHSEPGTKDITAIFSSLVVLLPTITASAPYLVETLSSILQFKQAKKIVLEETIKDGKSEYTRKVEIGGPIDKEVLNTMRDFFDKSVSEKASITLKISHSR